MKVFIALPPHPPRVCNAVAERFRKAFYVKGLRFRPAEMAIGPSDKPKGMAISERGVGFYDLTPSVLAGRISSTITG
jgi:hypothetical protein